MSEVNQPRTITEQEFSQLQERYRQTSEQLAQMKGTLDAVMVQRNQPTQPTLPKTRLTPEAAEDVTKLTQHMLTQALSDQQNTFRQAFNSLWDRTDLAEFRAVRPGEYDKYKDKIESLRQEKARMGQVITRDEAYKYVHFDETGKKPKETPVVTEAPKPVYDPYLQKWVLPTDEKAPPPQVVQQPVTNPAPVVKPPVVTLDGVQPEEFNLPPQGPMKSTVASPTGTSGPISLEVNSTAETLQAFEAKYGDVPL